MGQARESVRARPRKTQMEDEENNPLFFSILSYAPTPTQRPRTPHFSVFNSKSFYTLT